MYLKINGYDITSYIAKGGIKWQRQDVDVDAGRTMDGLMHRGRVATKIRLDITCIPLTQAQAMDLLQRLLPESVTVEYEDPMYGDVIKQMYANNHPAEYLLIQKDGTEYWSGITFPLIEM